MHQNKPTAPITYLRDDGKRVTLPEGSEFKLREIEPLPLTLPEIAIIQTLVNRSIRNCNCNLNKTVLSHIVLKIKNALLKMKREASHYENENRDINIGVVEEEKE